MSNLTSVFNIARTALGTQTYSLGVASQNIANVNTEGYTRQSPVLETMQSVSIGGLVMGQGVNTAEITRITDSFIESQLMQQKSKMSFSDEMSNYMQVIEGMFDADAETSISTMLSEFWNLWQDISNNPSGISERTALYEYSTLLSGQFNSLDSDLTSLGTDLNYCLDLGVAEINRITAEIALSLIHI